MQAKGIEVLYDDRDVRPGVMFSDADLIGAPIRITVSPRNMKEGVAEMATRDKRFSEKVALDQVLETTMKWICTLTEEIESVANAIV